MKKLFAFIFTLGLSLSLYAQTGASTLEGEEPQLGSDLEGRDPGVPMDTVPAEREEDRDKDLEEDNDAGVRGGTGMGQGAGTGLSGGVGTGAIKNL